ncbi:MAG: PilZ domain-containing protein [Planctomycetota bacterium]|jgi:hypothetical protein
MADSSTNLKFDNQRSEGRLAIDNLVTLIAPSGRQLSGQLVNLSAGGAMIRLHNSDEELTAGQPLELTIEWSYPSEAWVRGETLHGAVRHRNEQTIGIQFAERRSQAA